MDSRKIDLLNIGLIAVSLVAAFWMPFGLFLFSYAVLGPLHYMTEISWLDERAYFSKSKLTPWVLSGFVVLICLGSFFAEGAQNPTFSGFFHAINGSPARGFFYWLESIIVHLLLLAFFVGVALTAFSKWPMRWLVIGLGVAVAFAFRKSNTYTLLVGGMLPTFIHVFVFTGIFMLYGALKSNSRPGYWSVAAFIAAILAIVYWPIKAEGSYLVDGSAVSERFMDSGFQHVIYQLGRVLGLTGPDAGFAVNSELGIRLGVFLGFAYTYHYLNWFSKTSVIGWHQVSRRKLVGALVIWIFSIGLYLYDYRLGLLALLFLSLLHVVYEFPLNYISIRGSVQMIGQKFGLRQAQ